MSKNLSELAGRKGVVDGLFEKMGDAAVADGTPSKDKLDQLAKEFLVGTSSTYGAATFYDFMKPENKGKKAYVCNGSACLCAGTQYSVKAKLESTYSTDEVGHMTCLGRCHENSAFHVNGQNYSGSDIEKIVEIAGGESTVDDNYSVSATGKAILTSEYDKAELFDLIRKTLSADSSAALEEIKTSNIRGRGGAGFPMGIKLDSCRKEENDTKFIICNADEGDPGAYSDRYLLEKQPLLVLIGMMVSGYIIGSETGILYIRAEYPESVDVIEKAIQELTDQGLTGTDINGSGFNFNFKVIKAQGAYICGEETALINSIEGQRPEVRVRPPYPTQQGLFNKPTVVNNVETQAAVPFILMNGGAAYKALGTDRSSGTKLVCLDSFFNNPGIVEVEMGTSLDKVVNEVGGGFKAPVKALHIGGPLGGMVPTSKIPELNIDFESFSQNGFLLGHASVVSIPESMPMVKYLEHIFDFAAYESCGKCFPCRLGTTRGHEMFQKAINENYKIDMKLFTDLLTTLEEGSLCAHGGGIPLPVRNALQYFDSELKEYFS
ncbi:MAG: NADH:ubiquinone oxidoreductase subunit F (NADH-binding) [Bacteroidia bacterium]|jgi:NADH:ubiquinone oxidoreductase subunit F (NADH-binding)